MPRRVPPALADVARVLAPISQAAKSASRRDDLIRAAARHDPRPTNRQIAEAAGITEGAIRAVLTGRRRQRSG